MSLLDYEPLYIATKIHEVPRLGASDDLSLLATRDADRIFEYIRGVLGVSALIVSAVLLWLMVLTYLKCVCGRSRPACASGGGKIDIKQLREIHDLSRSQRKNIIRRQWRIQGLALFTCTLVVPATFVGIRLGLHPFLDALSDIRETNDQIESKAYQGKHIGFQLFGYYHNLTNLPMEDLAISDLCPNLFADRLLVTPVIDFGSLNATANETELMDNMLEWKDLLLHGLDTIDERFSSIQIPIDALNSVTNVTQIIDLGIDLILENDWYLKLGLLVLDVVVLFWSLGILTAQSNIEWIGMQRVAAYFFIPILLFMLPVLVIAACGFWTMLLINSDFCLGNDVYHSPLGSIAGIIDSMNETTSFDSALHYYGMVHTTIAHWKHPRSHFLNEQNCLATNPLQFLDKMEWELSDTINALEQIDINLGFVVDTFSSVCGTPNATILALNSSIADAKTSLTGIRGSLIASVQLTDCSSVIPVLRRLVYGGTCRESIRSLTAMFGCSLGLVITVLVLLTTRSAVFSPIVRGRMNKRRETEFKEYKQYMGQYYQTKHWRIDWVPPDDDELFHSIKRTTTQSTYSPSSSEESDTVVAITTQTPHKNGTFVNSGPYHESDDVDDDSYDSTYSSDNESDMVEASSMLSGLNRFFEKYRERDRSPTRLNESYSTSGSMVSDVRQKLSSVVNGTSFPSIMARVRDRYSQQNHVAENYSDQEDESYITDHVIDTRSAMLTTPEPVRYSTRSRIYSSAKRRLEDPDDFEMVALSPKQPMFSPADNRTQQTKALTKRRFVGYMG